MRHGSLISLPPTQYVCVVKPQVAHVHLPQAMDGKRRIVKSFEITRVVW